MRKLIYAIAALGALAWSGAAWAVVQETTVTLTDHGEPLRSATISLNRLTDSQPPPELKTEKTDESGKIVLKHEDEDETSDATVEVIVTTTEGKTFTRRLVLKELLTSEAIEVVVPSETHQAAESSQDQATKECADLTKLDDQQLEILVNNPELRARIVKLIEETERTEQTEQTEELQEGKKGTEKKSVSGKSKEKKVVRKKEKKHPTASAAPKSGPSTAKIVGTGLAIGLGIAGSQHGHGTGRRGREMDSGPSGPSH